MSANDYAYIRIYIFATLLISLIAFEFFLPRRKREISRRERWPTNFWLILIDSILAKLTLGAIPILVAESVYGSNFNLLGYFQLSEVYSIFATVIILDLLIYIQHILFHATPLFWRLHKVHHCDPDLDVTSGLRFHPIEILISLLLKIGGVIVVGAHPFGVFIFEIALNAGSLFNHSNININGKLDKILRLFIVTPDMHRIHHSTEIPETNSNFSFTISLWDRIFGTYRHSAKLSQKNINIGLIEIKKHDATNLGYQLFFPFRMHSDIYSFTGRSTLKKNQNQKQLK